MASPKTKSSSKSKSKQQNTLIKQKMKLPWLVVALAVGVFVGVGGYAVKNYSSANAKVPHTKPYYVMMLDGSPAGMGDLNDWWGVTGYSHNGDMGYRGPIKVNSGVMNMALVHDKVSSIMNKTPYRVCVYDIRNGRHILIANVQPFYRLDWIGAKNNDRADYWRAVTTKKCP